MALSTRGGNRAGAQFSISDANQFPQYRLRGRYTLTDIKAARRRWLAAHLAIFESGLGISNRHDHAREAAARPARRGNQLCSAGVALLLFLSDLHHHDIAQYRPSSNELFLSRSRFLCLPSLARVSGGSHLDPCGHGRLFGCFRGVGGELPQAGSGHAFRRFRGRNGATDLSRPVLLCLLLARFHRPFDHRNRDHYAVCRDASNRANSLVRTVCGPGAHASPEPPVMPVDNGLVGTTDQPSLVDRDIFPLQCHAACFAPSSTRILRTYSCTIWFSTPVGAIAINWRS